MFVQSRVVARASVWKGHQKKRRGRRTQTNRTRHEREEANVHDEGGGGDFINGERQRTKRGR